jgi:hypothetical protein
MFERSVVKALALAAPSVARASARVGSVPSYALTPERLGASAAVLLGLVGVVLGGMALARSAGRIGLGNGRRGAVLALVLAPIGLVVGGLTVATAKGGLGTGHGLGGGVVAMVVGLIGTVLGGLALARFRRIA